MAKEKMLNLRIPEIMKEDLKKAADKDKRSISDFIRIILKKFLDSSK